MLFFDVASLLGAPLGESLTLDVDTGPKVLDDLELGFLRGSVYAVRVEKGVFVEGVVESRLILDCVRCLESCAFPITLELSELYLMPGIESSPDAVYAVTEDGEIDLAPLVREHAWLAVPMKHLCHPECNGLCPHCGVNLNTESCECEEIHIDPRFAPLREYL